MDIKIGTSTTSVLRYVYDTKITFKDSVLIGTSTQGNDLKNTCNVCIFTFLFKIFILSHLNTVTTTLLVDHERDFAAL